MIVVDAYRQPYIPFYLATEEFFELVARQLAPGGVVVVNVGHPEGNDELETVLGSTMAAVFPTVLRDPVEEANTLLLGSEGRASGGEMLAALGDLPRGSAQRSPRTEAAGSARACRAKRSTPTISPRSSG